MRWKRLNRNDKPGHYGISQPDLYQMYAYGKKYQKTGAAPDLYLLYPHNKNFDAPFKYEYETGLRLTVFPVDLGKEKLVNELLPAAATCNKAA